MDYQITKLKNGLRVLTVPLEDFESATVTVWTRVGSRFEKDSNAGISHFLEHMVFKGTKKRPTSQEVATAVDAIGAQFNASTSKEWTNYYIKSRSGVIETAFDVLSDMVVSPLLKEDAIEREKGVILEEMGMYEDIPMSKVGDYFENLIFNDHDLGRDIIGLRETVTSLKREDFVEYRNTHYKTHNMLLTVSGGIDQDKVIELAEKYFGSLKDGDVTDYEKFNSDQKEPRIFLKNKNIEQAHFVLGFIGYPYGSNKRFAEAVLTTLLGGGMSSRLFTEVREKRGLAYAVRSDVDHYLDTGYISAYAGVDPKRATEAIKVILDLHYQIANGRHDIKDDELKKAKEYLKGHLALGLEDTKAINSFFGIKELMLGRVETPEEVFEGINKVTVEDLVEVAKDVFVKEKLNLAIIGPFKNEKQFEDLLK